MSALDGHERDFRPARHGVNDRMGGYRPDANEFSILGPIEVAAPDGPVEVSGPKERAALAVLVAWAGEVMSTERLAEALWGDEPPRSSGKIVQNLVMHLRKTLGPSVIDTRPGGYVLNAAPDSIDVRRFERLVAEGRSRAAAGDPTAAAALSAAVGLWRASPLPELEDWPPGRSEGARLEELHRCVVEDLAEVELSIGHHRECVARLEAMVDEEPLRERRWVLLMLGLYRCGRQADALRAYQRARAALGDLGLEPGPELQAMDRAVAEHDESLALSSQGATGQRMLPTGVVAFLLTDIEGSAPLWERAPTAMSEAVERHADLIEKAVTTSGGVFLKARGEGDSSFSVFTKTSAAVSAALAARDALEAEQWPTGQLAVRMAIHTGEAHERDGDYFGPTVNRAARLRGLATGGQILLSESVVALVRDELPEGWDLAELGEQALRGLNRPERVFTLVSSGAVIGRGATVVARSCPYMGLLAFQPEDDRLFFGRADVLASLTARVARDRFAAVVGASGSGKSSLLRAGLVAQLRRGAGSEANEWLTVVMTPGARPVAELAARIGPLCGDSATDLLRDLEMDSRSLDVAVRQALAPRPSGTKFALVVDQLEELFTLCRDDEARRTFLDALVDAASTPDGPAVVVALRADFFGHCASHHGLARLLETHSLLVGVMDEAGLREAIEGPARVAGLTLEPGLADLVLRDVAGEPGGLPLLSHALLEVWKRRDGRILTIAGYGASGGVSGAIAGTADAVYESFDVDEQRVVRSVFLRLTELGDGTEDTRRRATLEELASESAAGTERTEVVLDTLVAARLVTVSAGTIEVAHEALIREWPRLRAWLDEDREGFRVMRHLTCAAHDWVERGRDDSELYRGPRLAAALEWRASGHQEDLNPLENEFLDAGQREIEARASAQLRATRRLHRLLAGVGVALVLALIAGALALDQRNRTNSERDRANTERDRANSERDRAAAVAEAEAVRRLAVQSRAAQDTSLELSLLLAVEANRRDDSSETRGALQSGLLSNPQLLGFLRGSASAYTSVAIDRTGVVAAGSREGTVDLWNDDRRPIGTLPAGSGSVTVAFADSGSLLGVLSEEDHTLSLWDVTTMARVGEPFTTDAAIGNAATFAFSPDGRQLSAALGSGEIATWDVATRVETGARLRSGDDIPFRAVAYSPDSRLLATGTVAGDMAFYDVQSREPAAVPLSPGPTTPPTSMAFNPQGSLLVAGTAAGPTFMWELSTGQLVASPLLLSTTNGQVAFSEDGTRLALGSGSETLELMDPARPDEALASVHTQGGVQRGVAYSPDGRYVAVANGGAGSVAIVDVVGERKLGHPLPTAPLQYGVFSPDGSMLAAADWADGSLSLLDPDSGRVIRRLEPPGMRPISALVTSAPAFSPDGRLVAYGGLTGRVAIFDVATGDVVKTLTPPPATTDHDFINPAIAPVYVGPLAFSPDGTKLVSAALETATLFDLGSGQQLAQLAGWDLLATNAIFTPDGRYVVISGFQSKTLVFDSTTGEQVGEPIGDSTAPAYVANNGLPDTLMTSDFTGHIRFVDLRTRTQVGPPMTGRAVAVSSVVLLPGGDRVVAGFFGGTASEAWMFERATGQAIGDPFPSLAQYSALSVSPDGKTLITGDGTQMMRWDIDWTTWRQAACRVAGRNLTQAEWTLYLPNGGPYRATCPEYPG